MPGRPRPRLIGLALATALAGCSTGGPAASTSAPDTGISGSPADASAASSSTASPLPSGSPVVATTPSRAQLVAALPATPAQLHGLSESAACRTDGCAGLAFAVSGVDARTGSTVFTIQIQVPEAVDVPARFALVRDLSARPRFDHPPVVGGAAGAYGERGSAAPVSLVGVTWPTVACTRTFTRYPPDGGTVPPGQEHAHEAISASLVQTTTGPALVFVRATTSRLLVQLLGEFGTRVAT